VGPLGKRYQTERSASMSMDYHGLVAESRVGQPGYSAAAYSTFGESSEHTDPPERRTRQSRDGGDGQSTAIAGMAKRSQTPIYLWPAHQRPRLLAGSIGVRWQRGRYRHRAAPSRDSAQAVWLPAAVAVSRWPWNGRQHPYRGTTAPRLRLHHRPEGAQLAPPT
jgi:hypothetical protein